MLVFATVAGVSTILEPVRQAEESVVGDVVLCDGGRSTLRNYEGSRMLWDGVHPFFASTVSIDEKITFIILYPDVRGPHPRVVNFIIDDGEYVWLTNEERDQHLALMAPNLANLVDEEDNDCTFLKVP